jgi:hypothetical protein
LDILNNSNDILVSWQNINKDKKLSPKQKTFNKFIDDDMHKILKEYAGKTFADIKKEQIQFRNHKISKIEYLQDRVDTGCLTIDGNEIYHNNHTFALDAGVYTQNSMLEDFWLPRREGSRGTEITTLPGGQNLGELEDVKYFERKLYKALGVPIGRLENQQGFSLGKSTEITREELKFSKFVQRLRNKFATLFDDLLRIQLILKKVCTEEEWKEFKEDIWYDFQKDNNFTELKEAELLTNRILLLQYVDPFVGRYYSKEWVQKNVLMQTDEDIEEINQQISQEQEQAAPTADGMVDPMQQNTIPGFGGNQIAPPQSSAQGQQQTDQPMQEQAPMPSKFELRPNEMEMV